MSQAWVRHRERGTVFSLKLIAHIALQLGRPVARSLLYPICLYFILFSRGGRRASQEYLARVLGRPVRARDVFRHHFVFAATLVDRVFMLTGRHNLLAFTVHGVDPLRALLARGRGCLLLGAHLGSFDLVRAIAGSSGAPTINMMMYEDNARKINEVIASLGGREQMKVIPIGEIDGLLRAQGCVERGEIVGILGDRVLGGEKTVVVPFFGSPVALPAGPYLVARALEVPVVLFFGLYRGGNRYEIYFELFAEKIDIDRRRPQPDLERWARRYAERLEHYCQFAPYNWFNFFDYWHPPVPLPDRREARAA